MKARKPPEPIPIDPLVDPVFKVLFGTETNKDILLDFLNAVLEFIGTPLAVSIELVPPRNLRRYAQEKETEVDVRAKDATGRVFQIEVQLDPGGPLIDRMLFGAGQLYASTLEKGQSYSELKPVVAIWLLRDRLPCHPSDSSGAVTDYRFRDRYGTTLGDYPAIVVIELKKWNKNVILKKRIEQWLFFFAHGKELSLTSEIPPQIRSEVFMKAVTETKRFNDSWAKRMAYESYMDKVRWNNALKEEAEAQYKQNEAQRKQDEAQRKQDEAQRKQDEAQRKQDEAQRKQDEAFRLETDRLAEETENRRRAIQLRERETERKVHEAAKMIDEAEKTKRESKIALVAAFRSLIESGKTPAEAAKTLGVNQTEITDHYK
ncbi:MAG: Rpn family recombination-promoting nuclease/putative transposase [Treponemataceae bacterium]